jgi:hypothetical protein
MASPSPACKKALADATARWPRRNKASDGIMGDARHQARKSDHNLGNAVDITHDPRSGCDGNVIAALAIRDSRITYVIFNRKIWSVSRAREGWRKYTGSNPHTSHVHISIRASARNDARAWAWADPNARPVITPDPTPSSTGPSGATAARPHDSSAYPNVILRRGSRGPLVRRVQERLRAQGWGVDIDGVFGPDTDGFVKRFQRRHGLLDDGVVGRKTWNALF